MSVHVYERITERIIALLEQGTVPWHRPWNARTDLPRNLVTKKPYRGINVFLLLSMSYESPFWVTFRQAIALGGSVRKGEKACPVVFWKPVIVADKESGESRQVPFLRFYHVFNMAQCDGLGDKVPAASMTEHSDELDAPQTAKIVGNMPKRPLIKHGMVNAYYSPREDVVGLPAQHRFESSESYYAALFHELVHATGHATRLNRTTLTGKAGFGSDPYCKEELVAEIGAAFLCGHAEIVERTITNSAAYLKNWLERLRNDKTLVVQAAAQAQKAADFILNRHFADSEVEHD